MLLKMVYDSETIACQELSISGALALLRLAKESGSLSSKWTKEDTDYSYVDSALYFADTTNGTVNMLEVYVEPINV